MKARIKKTNEILQIAEYSKPTMESCDSYGNPLEFAPEEVELINDTDINNIDWEQRRYELAKAAMQGILSDRNMLEYGYYRETCGETLTAVTKFAVNVADALIKELKGK